MGGAATPPINKPTPAPTVHLLNNKETKQPSRQD
jgi:hypothetical protein